MPKEGINIRFHGFKPSESEEKSFFNMLEHLLDQAPYGSSIFADFFEIPDGFRGDLQIFSVAGRFSASGHADQLLKIKKDLLEKIQAQIKNWKAIRFTTGAKIKNSNHGWGAYDYTQTV